MQFTSVKVTPEAQRAFLEKNPQLTKKAVATAGSSTAVASTSRALDDITKSLKRNGAVAGVDPAPASKKVQKT